MSVLLCSTDFLYLVGTPAASLSTLVKFNGFPSPYINDAESSSADEYTNILVANTQEGVYSYTFYAGYGLLVCVLTTCLSAQSDL